jgi:drug/metabolite transporter (DMT)-like permease
LFVGIAYFLTAVLAPLAVLWLKGATWTFTLQGSWWSLVAGIVGAIGAFCVLLAFGAGGTPSVVMTIVFAGAPIVNAVVALLMHPPAGGWGAIRWPFFCGILLAALGGALVTLYKPPPAKAPAPQVAAVPPVTATEAK